MENTKRARREKSRIRPSAETYVKPKGLLSGLERVREVVVNASALLPEVGARCVSSARRDLCGGCRVTGIPTATEFVDLLPSIPISGFAAYANSARDVHSEPIAKRK